MLPAMAATSLRPARGADDRLRRSAAVARVACALLLVAAAPLATATTRSDLAAFGLLVVFVWIPASTLVAAASLRRPSPRLDAAALALDLGLLLLADVLLAPHGEVLVAALLVPVAVGTYLGGRAVGVLGALGAVVITAAAGAGAFTVTVYPGMLGLLAWLFDAVANERRRATNGLERSDAILTGIGEAVVVTDAGGVIQQWNRAATATFGCDAPAARGRSCHAALGLDRDGVPVDCSLGCALLGEATDVPVPVWRWSATGVRQPLLASVLPVVDHRGHVVEVVHSYRDIARLRQAEEAKSLFLATASHELKTPLTVIRGFAQMLSLPEEVLGGDERQAALRAIQTRADELAAIVDRLLLSSRIEAGRVDLEPSAGAAEPILRARANAFERATGREIGLDLADALPDVWIDHTALVTVVDHLLDNALKYSPSGGAVVVSAVPSADGARVEVAVTDRGIGMSTEQATRCFDRFWQAEVADVRRFGGTGIGLYIVRALLDGMGASISVASTHGRGSTFRMSLRRADNPETLEDPTAAIAAP